MEIQGQEVDSIVELANRRAVLDELRNLDY